MFDTAVIVRAAIEYTPVRTSLVARALLGLGFVTVAWWVATIAFAAEPPRTVSAVTLMACGAFFAWVAAGYVRQLFDERGLVADDGGFSFRSVWKRQHFAWSEVSEFRVVPYRGLRLIGFDLVNANATITININRRSMGVDAYILAHTFSAPVEEVCELLNERRSVALAFSASQPA